MIHLEYMVADQEEIHRLSLSENADERLRATKAFVFEFRSLPDKSAAWDDLLRLTNDDDSGVRREAASALGYAFQYIPEERQSAAWADLHRLTSNEDLYVRTGVAYAFGFIFQYFPEECQSTAWADLHRLTSDEYFGVRSKVAYAFGFSFQYFPEECQSTAWADLHRLISDENSDVIIEAAFSLGSAFQYIPEEHKSDAWADLHRLTIDKDSDVRMHASHSLGKICIYKASKSEKEDYAKDLLENAINYFEKAAKETRLFNPAKFCSTFYRSFDAVIFKRVYSKKEIEDYIKAAKDEIGNSKSKQKLVEAVEHLAEVLEIVHSTREVGDDWQETLKYCSDICNHVEQLMDENKDKTPAIYNLYKIAKPSFDKNIKELIDNIREKIEIGHKKAVGTPYEDLFNDAEKEVKDWENGTDEENLAKIGQIIEVIREKMPPKKVEVMHDELNKTIVKRDIPKLLEAILKMIQEITYYSNPSEQKDEAKRLLSVLLLKVSQLETNTNRMNETVNKIDKTTLNINETTIRTENKVDLILQTVNELKDLSSNLKEEGNEKGSQDVNDIADKIKVLLENKDPKEISLFIEKIQEEVPSLLEEIEKSSAPKDVKEKAKLGLKDILMRFGKDISAGVATNWIAAYLPSIVGAGASGMLIPAIIIAALTSIYNVRDQRKK